MPSLLCTLLCASLVKMGTHGGFQCVVTFVPVNEDVLEACVYKVGH